MKKVIAIKKPIEVTAIQLDKPTKIRTLEGTMSANKGDWLLTGIQGEQWAVKKDIFNQTYQIIKQI